MNFWNLKKKLILLPLVNALCLDSESIATNIYCKEPQVFPWNKAITNPFSYHTCLSCWTEYGVGYLWKWN